MEKKETEKINPTIRELQRIIGTDINSVAYNRSRSVLNNLDVPVLSYGVGYAGFIAIYKNNKNQLNAVSYSVKQKEGYEDACFVPLDVEIADKRIKEERLFAMKKITDLEKIPRKEVYKRPFVGVLRYVNKSSYQKTWDSYYNERDIKVERFKKGTLWVKHNYKYYNQTEKESDFLRTLDDLNNKLSKGEAIYMNKKDFENIEEKDKDIPEQVETIIFENTLPKELAEEIRGRELVKQLKL